MRVPGRWLATPSGIAVLVLVPWLVRDYQRIFIAEIFIWGLFAMSFALVYTWGGMLSFAQAVFFGAGSWGFNVATLRFQLGTWGAVLCSMAAAAALAVPVGYIATRVRHHHFLIVTVIFSVLVSTVLSSGHWRWIGGPYVTYAFTFVPEVHLGVATYGFNDEIVAYYFTAAVVTLAVFVSSLLVASPFGRALLAIADNEVRAELIGLDVKRLRWAMFVIAAAVAGLAGCLYALLSRFTSLEFWDWTYSGKAVVMAILGGAGSLAGPFLGTAFYMVATEVLSRHFEQFVVLVGMLLLLVVRFAPDGLWGLMRRSLAQARKR
jgi:branched-chain amino acid transport system permease protein